MGSKKVVRVFKGGWVEQFHIYCYIKLIQNEKWRTQFEYCFIMLVRIMQVSLGIEEIMPKPHRHWLEIILFDKNFLENPSSSGGLDFSKPNCG